MGDWFAVAKISLDVTSARLRGREVGNNLRRLASPSGTLVSAFTSASTANWKATTDLPVAFRRERRLFLHERRGFGGQIIRIFHNILSDLADLRLFFGANHSGATSFGRHFPIYCAYQNNGVSVLSSPWKYAASFKRALESSRNSGSNSNCFVCNLPILSHQVGLVWQGGNGVDDLLREQMEMVFKNLSN